MPKPLTHHVVLLLAEDDAYSLWLKNVHVVTEVIFNIRQQSTPCQLTIAFMNISLQPVMLFDLTQGRNFKTWSPYSQTMSQLCQLGSHNTLFLHGYGNSVYSILTSRFYYNKLYSLFIHKKQFLIYISVLSWYCSN